MQLLIAEVIALVEPDARRNGITCRADVPDGLPELRADPALLRQALLNLALNGCQAMADGGKLTMGAQVEKDRRLALTVEDTGAGHLGGYARSDFRPVLHDQARRQRHRAVDCL